MSDKLDCCSSPHSGERQEAGSIASRTVFIGGIPLFSTTGLVARYLSQFDFVVTVEIPCDSKRGMPKGFAKAVLGSQEGVKTLLACRDHKIGGLQVGISIWKDPSQYLSEKDQQVNKKIFVKYPPELKPSLLETYFSSIGTIVRVDHKKNPVTNMGRNFCYITFDSVETALSITKASIHLIDGLQVFCEMSKPAHLEREARRAKKLENHSMHHKAGNNKPKGSTINKDPTNTCASHLNHLGHRSNDASSPGTNQNKLENTLTTKGDAFSSLWSNRYCKLSWTITEALEGKNHYKHDKRKTHQKASEKDQSFAETFTCCKLKNLSENIKPGSWTYAKLKSRYIRNNHADANNLRFTLVKARVLSLPP